MWASTGPVLAALGALPALAATGTLLWAVVRTRTAARRRISRLGHGTAACAVVSLAFTFALPAAAINSGWKLTEATALLLLTAAASRWSPGPELRCALPLAALAVTLWPVRLVPGESFLEATGIATFWLLPVAASVVAGAYPRRQELRRRRAVTEARRAQRVQLSRDLHDFVAHDISGIIVQAQAARFVAATDPSQAVIALERIEKAGLSALSSMDRTIEMLHGPEASATDPLPGVAQLPALVEQFSSAGSTEAHLDMPARAVGAMSREAGAAAYRIVVEALTNVRRHAPGCGTASIALVPKATTVEVRVTNDRGTGTAPARRRRSGGGRGLPALTAQAQALGGTLVAGTHRDGGWQLTATLPARPPEEMP